MAERHCVDREVTRRDFIRMGVAGGGAIVLAGRVAVPAEAKPKKTDIWVFRGTDKKKMMTACLKQIAKQGGFGKDAKKLTLKVNAAWWRTPEQWANTNPVLVDTFLKGCKDQGIKEIVIPENPVDPASRSFPRSGLLDVAKSNSVKMIDLRSDPGHFKEVELPKAKRLKKAEVGKHFLETDVVVNMPVAKHHGGASLTIAMKNWMGSVRDRRFWHRNDLHQCIADYSTFIKPKWIIVEAIRVMLDRGPKGPSKNMQKLDRLVLATDQVAADAYVASLLPARFRQRARFLTIAGEMKIGVTDVSQMAIHEIEVS